jgi:hypothetical protein
MTGRADRWIRWVTIGCVTTLAMIARTVSYLHMHELVALHGQPGWVAALTPPALDGMIVAASTTLLAESPSRRRESAAAQVGDAAHQEQRAGRPADSRRAIGMVDNGRHGNGRWRVRLLTDCCRAPN